MADPILNKSGLTELHLAAHHGELEWVQNCLRGGLSVHARDNSGYTPLHRAVDMGLVGNAAEREGIVDALVAAGADINARDGDGSGRTVLEVAIESEAFYLVRRLRALAAAEKGGSST